MKKFLAFVWLTQAYFSKHIQSAHIFKDARNADENIITSCLMNHTFYHPESKTCEVPLDDYSCPGGQWMVPDKNRLGKVHCEDIKADEECREGMSVIVMGNTMTIECHDKHIEKLQEIFQMSKCQNGQILLPSNFEVNTNPCPDKFSCREDYSEYLPEDGEEEKVNFLKPLICSKDPRKLCLPSDNKGSSLFTPENLIRSFVTADLECRENPCSEGSWPWIDEEKSEAIQKCLPIDDKCKSGDVSITKEPGASKLSCSSLVNFSVTGGADFNRCRRNRVFRRGKCRLRFFG